MKYLALLMVFVFIVPGVAFSETQEEQMQRMQRELNNRLFNMNDEQSEPAPDPVPEVAEPEPEPAAKAPEPKQASIPDPKPEPKPATSALPVATFTGYSLAGVSLGMEEASVLASLKDAGFACNVGGGAAAATALPGHTICIYFSTEEPRMVHLGMAGGQVREIELHEVYNGGFPAEYFEQEKNKFISQYGKSAKCKEQRRGEVCEVFGHGYRITLRSREKSSKSTLVRRIARRH